MREGYKQTEVGVIPEEWEACPLPNCIWFQEGPGLRKWQFRSSGLKVINVTNLQDNGYLDLSTTERYISWEECEQTYKHFLIDSGDVVMASSGNSYCKTAVVRQSDLPLVMNTSVIRFKAKENTVRSFMLAYLKSKYFKTQIDLIITGGAQPNFGPVHLKKVIIPRPPSKAEQTAIATALSDADALIESLEQLIAKKRNIKQGAMQELLTGKKRLPGFSGEWPTLKMAENSVLKARIGWQGLKTAEYLQAGEYYLVTGTDFLGGRINWDSCWFVDEKRYVQDRNIQLRSGDILLTKDGTIGKVAFINVLPKPATLNSGIFVIRPRDNAYLPLFLYYILCSHVFEDFLGKLQAGSTISHLYQKDFVNFSFMVPDIKEQTAIASVLSDMDAEIEALERKLAKYRLIKQGMMQELLTGKTRLI